MSSEYILETIPAGTSVCNSIMGHNNFVYPHHDDCVVLSEDIAVSPLAFAGGGDLTAYSVIGTNQIIWANSKDVIKVVQDEVSSESE